MNRIKRAFKLYIIRVKLALKDLNLEMFLLYVFLMLPIYIIYKITGLVVYLHDFSADVYNKLDTFVYNQRK